MTVLYVAIINVIGEIICDRPAARRPLSVHSRLQTLTRGEIGIRGWIGDLNLVGGLAVVRMSCFAILEDKPTLWI